ncbi:hypothetical protein SPICUR_04545 [Spiribacter curvatus]|uniref:FeS cluster biogenesis domain-containing protein n=1 Tax=Spiribacter curvatus TaxID=1335757 RepID=U5T6C8_9GAMM|nr:CC/Se motif family (seleno)protein [Spiribacter curvatus]AGY91888.1 hypothetical protein SPICUR_04545 [Spiribacter curvatus]
MADLSLTIDPAARRWIRDRGSVVTLRAAPRHGCCGGMARLPEAAPGASRDAADWETLTVDAVVIHIDPMLSDAGQVLTIRVEGFLGWRRLFVEADDPVEGSMSNQSM